VQAAAPAEEKTPPPQGRQEAPSTEAVPGGQGAQAEGLAGAAPGGQGAHRRDAGALTDPLGQGVQVVALTDPLTDSLANVPAGQGEQRVELKLKKPLPHATQMDAPACGAMRGGGQGAQRDAFSALVKLKKRDEFKFENVPSGQSWQASPAASAR
jgi:hypothetical protein